MARNLFVSYDLKNPGQNYDQVIAEIKKHGAWAKVEFSLFYLSSNETASQVGNAVWSVMDSNDKLIVIDATTNDASMYGLGNEVTQFIQQHWNARAAA